MRTNSASSVFGRECPPCNPNYYLTPEVNQLAINACVRDRRADDSRPNYPAWVVWLMGVQYTQIVLSRGRRALPTERYGDRCVAFRESIMWDLMEVRARPGIGTLYSPGPHWRCTQARHPI